MACTSCAFVHNFSKDFAKLLQISEKLLVPKLRFLPPNDPAVAAPIVAHLIGSREYSSRFCPAKRSRRLQCRIREQVLAGA